MLKAFEFGFDFLARVWVEFGCAGYFEVMSSQAI
jgi:hypothetical protein